MVSKHVQSCYFIQNGRHLYLIDGNLVQNVQFKEAWKYHMGQHNDLVWKFQSIWKKGHYINPNLSICCSKTQVFKHKTHKLQ